MSEDQEALDGAMEKATEGFGESLFADEPHFQDTPPEEETEEATAEGEESSEVEEAPEEEGEVEESEGDISDEDEPEEETEAEQTDERTVPLEALHAERHKRQERDTQIKELQAAIESQKTSSSSAERQLEAVKKQIEELDLGDIIKIDAPQTLPPEVQKLIEQQQAQAQQSQVEQTMNDIRTEVATHRTTYKNLDFGNSDQGETLMGMITSAMVFGTDMETAVEESMTRLDGIVGKANASGKKARQPAVKPKRKLQRSTKANTANAGRKQAEAIQSGNTFDYFKTIADEMVKNHT